MSLAPEVRRGGGLPFGQFVSQWVCDPRYSTNCRTLYSILVTYADIGARDTKKGKPYRRELANQLGTSLSTLDRTIEEGECAGLWRVESRRDPKQPKLNDSNIYHLYDGEFWRGEWTDPLEPGQTAAEAAKAQRAARVAKKRAAGYVHKGGRKKGTGRPEEGGVTGDATPPEEGGVMGEATPGVTGEATPASPVTPNIQNPIQNPDLEPPRPSVPEQDPPARASDPPTPDGQTDGDSSAREDQEEPALASGPTAPAVEPSPGVALLQEIGAARPELVLIGDTLRDQGLMVNGLLAAGWSRAALWQIIAGRPLPDPLTGTVGGVISWRLRTAAKGPVPPATASRTPEPAVVPAQPTAPRRALAAPEPPRCDCGALADVTDPRPLCAGCAGWPVCPGGCGRHVPVGTAEPCGACRQAAYAAEVAIDPAPDGSCAGWGPHQGDCGQQVTVHGMCRRCYFECEQERRRQADEEAHARLRRTDPGLAAAIDAATAAARGDHHTAV